MPKLFNIKSYNKLYNRIKLEVNNMHFTSTDYESYSNDKYNFTISYSRENAHI